MVVSVVLKCLESELEVCLFVCFICSLCLIFEGDVFFLYVCVLLCSLEEGCWLL